MDILLIKAILATIKLEWNSSIKTSLQLSWCLVNRDICEYSIIIGQQSTKI